LVAMVPSSATGKVTQAKSIGKLEARALDW
jgi:hypothetical protein